MIVSPQRRRRNRCGRYVIPFVVVVLATSWNFYSSQIIFAGQTNLGLGLDMHISSPNALQEPLLQPPDSFSACLLIMDENFRLYEWLSYHYHVLPLRYAVIAVDPRSELLPDSVLDVFRKELNMTIVRWTDSDFAEWNPLPANATSFKLTDRYKKRQSRFIAGCMEHLKQHNRTWTALWDVDEYIVFQGYGRKDKQNETIVSPPNLTEPGTILNYIQQTEIKTCVPMNRVEVGTKENPKNSMLQNSSLQLDPLRLDTLRYRYRNRFGGQNVGNNLGKVFLNVQRVNFPMRVYTPHRPAMQICPPPHGKIVNEGPFFVMHYVGSWPAYSFRNNDARKGVQKTKEAWQKRTRLSLHLEIITETWLDGFVRNVTKDRAWRLLRHAGLPEGYDGSTTGYEAFIAAEAASQEDAAATSRLLE